MKKTVVMLAAVLMLPALAVSVSAQSITGYVAPAEVQQGQANLVKGIFHGVGHCIGALCDKIARSGSKDAFVPVGVRVGDALEQAAYINAVANQAAYEAQLHEASQKFDEADLEKITSRNGKYVRDIVRGIRQEVAEAESLQAIGDCQKSTQAALISQRYRDLYEYKLNAQERSILFAYLEAPMKVKFQEESFSIKEVIGAWYSFQSSVYPIERNSITIDD